MIQTILNKLRNIWLKWVMADIPYVERIVGMATMYSPSLRSFYLVEALDTGNKRVSKLRGEGHPQAFILAMRHNEPIFICNGRPNEEELDLLVLLYDS